MPRISIDPITRLEGHGKIDIFLDDNGDVKNAYLQIPELRGFERFCVGRPVEDLPNLTSRICGVCPEAHHMAGTKALDAVFHVDPPPTAKKLRELFYSIFFATDHTTHFYALGGPDFVVGPDAPPAERNILGVVKKVGLEVGGKVINMRKTGHDLIQMMGGRRVHPNWGVPGGVSKGITEEQRKIIEEKGREAIEFAKFSLKVFDDLVLANTDYVNLIKSDMYAHKTYNMGMVDAQNRVNFYDGMVRVTSPSGKEHAKYSPDQYRDYVAEHVEPWSYLKFPYLKKVGWKGFVDGEDSGVYKATPLSRCNVADGMATPLAQKEWERMYSTLGGRPVHHTLATHWARLIELLYATERWVELATDPQITSKEYRVLPTATPTEGVGCVEAPRGTLTHHYVTDERGIVTRCNLIVGTTNNNAPINMSIAKAAKGLIKKGVALKEALLNKVEMAFRAYDPCFGCATHFLPGQMPLEVRLRDERGEILERLTQNL
ncbi:MAG TPA: Ni/Fe hydrogenase subunit alpha [Phycisphaerae bacterium]|nr:Ni/Fe hydrogenase subunit alpha [Phycisphaerae bacterium]HOJ75911.1 Ni/Fe hydrogenase subunit alpha [Phycisphaerae bacterium]HOM52313.1 Ni/Fe hydrogenase subunit alpha [Phycisphaerae bacterium]HON65661.1 Ni/Fe hydrogenase subunit alpha [Phycisphaerae bacterium]HOQ84637.1 Ni/Fe hydrogenase subunit alpha [Phycisphaerae bacterium]